MHNSETAPTIPAQPVKDRLTAWLKTIRAQVGLALAALFLLLAGSVAYTLYELDLRKHDYEILNLAGQLRVTSHAMVNQAGNYLKDTPTDYEAYNRDLRLFYGDLQRNIALYDKIISNFEARRLDADLTGKHETIYCTWDERSKSQLSRTADIWRTYRAGMFKQLGDDLAQPRLNYAAAYMVTNGKMLLDASNDLAIAFQTMMEGKLALIRLFNQIILGLAAGLMLGLVALIYFNLVRPLRQTVSGFARVARGDFGHQVPVQTGNEIGQMTRAFNQLSERLHALFRLTDRINQGNTLDDSLRFIAEEFRDFLPVDWVGLFFQSADGTRWVLERQHDTGPRTLREAGHFMLPGDKPDLSQPLNIADLSQYRGARADDLFATLHRYGFASATLLPMAGAANSQALLIFAARQPGSYTTEHVEFLSNVAGQITHSLDKTVFLENLVVATVQGLAKLAESRDPETGDHLLRMALYAAIVAEELGENGEYREQINTAYVREVFQFAPMHDIGKVGIADHILLKPGRLDEEQRREMERHPSIGGEVLRRCEAQVNGLGYSIFRVAIEIAECHHEKFDGSGYPKGLQGEAIPLSARIVAVADVFDALTSKRPYKEAWPVERALGLLDEEAGRHFDPEVVAAFKRSLPRVMAIYDQHKHV
ncbi:MAG: HD domain-containing protein [Hydrogenophilaceae bacterium]|nr:HD domain-containing protein [Hydrogenophilaceae bacterium]